MIRIIAIVMVLTMISCKGDKAAAPTNTNGTALAPKPKFDDRLPAPCELLSASSIASLVSTDEQAIEIKEASNAQNLFSRACFFKWDDPSMSDAGVMIQIMTNPVEDEAPEYLELFIASKKTAGETTMGSDEKVLYSDFPGYGDDGAYSFQMHKYLWRIGYDYSFLLAFNTALSEEQELAAANTLAAEIMKNVR